MTTMDRLACIARLVEFARGRGSTKTVALMVAAHMVRLVMRREDTTILVLLMDNQAVHGFVHAMKEAEPRLEWNATQRRMDLSGVRVFLLSAASLDIHALRGLDMGAVFVDPAVFPMLWRDFVEYEMERASREAAPRVIKMDDSMKVSLLPPAETTTRGDTERPRLAAGVPLSEIPLDAMRLYAPLRRDEEVETGPVKKVLQVEDVVDPDKPPYVDPAKYEKLGEMVRKEHVEDAIAEKGEPDNCDVDAAYGMGLYLLAAEFLCSATDVSEEFGAVHDAAYEETYLRWERAQWNRRKWYVCPACGTTVNVWSDSLRCQSCGRDPSYLDGGRFRLYSNGADLVAARSEEEAAEVVAPTYSDRDDDPAWAAFEEVDEEYTEALRFTAYPLGAWQFLATRTSPSTLDGHLASAE